VRLHLLHPWREELPFHTEESDLDVPLPDGTNDDAFLASFSKDLDRVLDLSEWDLAIFLAGADPFEGDKLGCLTVTKEGLAERNRMVLEACRGRDIPVAVTRAGGYVKDVEDTVDIHFQTVQRAAALLEAEKSVAGWLGP
jgi:acetoin utilization deacetylase AcuC-like enzyme